jgi:plasmid stabilization system protein ParE
MTLPIVFRPLARVEYDDDCEFYTRKSRAAGAKFVRAVEGALSIISGQPDRYPIAEDDIREAPVMGFPYCVYYVVEADRIRVLSVFHNSRDPAIWKGRR